MCAISCATMPSSSAGAGAPSSPVLTTIDELEGLRPTESARGKLSGITYSRGFTTRARTESCSTVVCSAGASPEVNCRAPTIPSTMRSEYQ